MSIEALINKGVVQLNVPSQQSEQRTIVIVGCARGGTSIPAGMLNKLGVPMFAVSPPVFEDVNLSNAFEEKDDKRLKKIIKKYNAEDTWAWKRPSALNYLDLVESKLRNPYFVYIFRDIMSVANRNKISMGLDLVGCMQSAIHDYQKMVDFIRVSKSPALICSSEKDAGLSFWATSDEKSDVS